jgi:ribosome-binding protein aMBF1 (putative translation factor)
MSDLQKYIKEKKKSSPEFAHEYDALSEEYELRQVLRQMRKDAGLTQKELAKRLNTKETAISRIENHALDIRLSTLEQYAQACGRHLKLVFA